MKESSNTLGFLTRETLKQYLCRQTVLGIKLDDDLLVGYLLYAEYPDRIRLAHLCVSDRYRNRGFAKKLFKGLREQCTTQYVIQLNCRRDYLEANSLWHELGFIPIDEKPGKSQEGHPLTRWQYRIMEDRQLDIFNQDAPEHVQKIVVDTHILIHFDAPPSPESIPSKALLADSLADLIQINLTDEVLLEVNRQQNQKIRRKSRNLAHSYTQATYDQKLAKGYENRLEALLKPSTTSDRSDISHLAKTAASGIGTFVTLDAAILKHSTEIANLTHLEVVSPVELITRLHERLEIESYNRLPISGQELVWRKARSADLDNLLDALRRPNEIKGKLREMLHIYLSRPSIFEFSILFEGDQILGARVSTEENDLVTISFVRAAISKNQELNSQFLISDILATCIEKGLHAIQYRGEGLSESMEEDLFEMGFCKVGSDYRRLCLTGPLTRAEISKKANRYFSDASNAWESLSDHEILTRCSPVVLKDIEEVAILVPIKPAYAMSLFDKQAARSDLFGGKSKILMRWKNAYFRSKSHHLILQAPARILWYESGKVGAITACSHLLSVEIGLPKDMFRKFQESGTLDWSSIYDINQGDLEREIMVLEFSHTFTFRKPVTLNDLRDIENRDSVPLQSPRLIKKAWFLRIMEMGCAGVSG